MFRVIYLITLEDGSTFEIDTCANIIVDSNGISKSLQSKSMKLLAYMIERENKVLTRQDLFDSVWAGTPVVDGALTNAIGKIRKILESRSNDHKTIETIPKVGYRLNVSAKKKVELADSIEKNNRNSAPPVKSKLFYYAICACFLAVIIYSLNNFFPRVLPNNEKANSSDTHKLKPSLAILPFKEIGLEPAPIHIQTGLARSIRDVLAKNPYLRVTSMNSSKSSALSSKNIIEIAQELNVSFVLKGAIEKNGSRYHISVEVFDGETGLLLLELEDNNEISTSGLKNWKLVSELSRFFETTDSSKNEHNTSNIEAYDLYLLGRYYLNKRDAEELEKARAYFIRALNIDPNFTLAHSSLAEVYLLLPHYSDFSLAEAEKLAEKAIYKALSIDSNLAEAHAVLGLLKVTFGEYESATKSYLRALELLPNNSDIWYRLGRAYRNSYQIKLADLAFEKALEIDPLNLIYLSNHAELKIFNGQVDAGIKLYSKIFQLEPNSKLHYSYAAHATSLAGRHKTAEEWARRAVQYAPTNPKNVNSLIFVQLNQGKINEAQEHIRTFHENVKFDRDFRRSKYLYYILAGEFNKLELFSQKVIGEVKNSQSYSERSHTLPVYYARLAVSKIHLGNFSSAIKYLEDAMSSIEENDDKFRINFLGYLSYAYLRAGEEALFKRNQKIGWEVVKRISLTAPANLKLKMFKLELLALEGRNSELINELSDIRLQGLEPGHIFKSLPYINIP